MILIGIYEIQESYADQMTWKFGDGLEKDDYFSYKLCQIDYKDCLDFQMNIWIQNDEKRGSEEWWVTKTTVFDGNKVLTGKMYLGKVSPEPICGSEELTPYIQAFKSSITWISGFSYNDSKKWKESQFEIYYNETEIITTKAGIFDSHVFSWNFNNQTSKVWVVDDLPFPVKAKTFDFVSKGKNPILYEFELLRHEKDVLEDPFLPVALTEGGSESLILEKFEDCTGVGKKILSPIKQIKQGINFEDIKCKNELQLIFKIDDFPACVKPESIPKLIERGWARN